MNRMFKILIVLMLVISISGSSYAASAHTCIKRTADFYAESKTFIDDNFNMMKMMTTATPETDSGALGNVNDHAIYIVEVTKSFITIVSLTYLAADKQKANMFVKKWVDRVTAENERWREVFNYHSMQNLSSGVLSNVNTMKDIMRDFDTILSDCQTID